MRAPSRIVARLDMAVLVLALPVFLLADLPLAGYAAVAIGWIAQAAVQHSAQARLARTEGRTNALGVIGGSIVIRLWVITIPILIVGLAFSREAGLAAAVTAAVLVTVQFAAEAALRVSASRRSSG
jgi:hypothetical protein